MKEVYTPAELEIMQFSAEDVITGSPLVDENGLPIYTE
jgi:hypothetical protein